MGTLYPNRQLDKFTVPRIETWHLNSPNGQTSKERALNVCRDTISLAIIGKRREYRRVCFEWRGELFVNSL